MDVISRAFRPANPITGRHMTVLRHCVKRDEATVMLTRCVRPDRPLAGEFLMLLTCRRLVVTQQTRVLKRLRLHLNAPLRHLSGITISLDERRSALEIGATAIDGVRERFLVRLVSPEQARALADVLRSVFHERADRLREPLKALTA